MKNYQRVERSLRKGFDSIETIADAINLSRHQVASSLLLLRQRGRAHISGVIANRGGNGGRICLYSVGPAPKTATQSVPSASASWDFRVPDLDGCVRGMSATVQNWMWLQ